MPSAKKPELTSGQSLDVQPGVANIGENRATLEALKNANIDGQDTYPQSVSAKRMSSEDIDVSGLVRSGQMLVGAGGVTVTSDPAGGTPNTGLHIASSVLQLIKDDVPQVTLDGSTGDATFIGAITATSGTFTGTVNATAGYFVGSITIGTDTTVGGAATGTWLTNTQLLMKKSGVEKVNFNTATDTYYIRGTLYATQFTVISNAANSVVFGADVTIGGDLILDPSTTGRSVIFDGSASTGIISYFNSSGAMTLSSLLQAGLLTLQGGSASYDAAGLSLQGGASLAVATLGIIAGDACDVYVKCGTTSSSHVYLARGATTVMSFAGDSNTVTFAGDIIVSGSTGFTGDIVSQSIDGTSTSVSLVISSSCASGGTGIELLNWGGAALYMEGDSVTVKAYWNSPNYDQLFYFCSGNRHFEIASANSGIKLYNNTASGDVAGNSVLMHAGGNLLFRDNGGTIHQIAYV